MKKQKKDREQLEQIATKYSFKLKLFSEIAEKSPVGLLILDADTQIIYSNSALEEVHGYSQEELTGTTFNKLNADAGFAEEVIFPSINMTGRWDGELLIRNKAGENIPISLAAFTVNHENGQSAGTIGIIRDITERKLVEDELIKHRSQLEKLVKSRTSELIAANKELIRENRERMQIEKKLLDHQKQLQSLTSQISLIEENEKRRIATELHDCIGQNLALSKIKLGQLGKSADSDGLKSDIGEILKIIEQTITETRTLTFELSPPILYELGLSQAIKWLIDQFKNKHGLEISLEDDGLEKPFENSIRLFLFQAVRELLVNTVKHSNADFAKIQMIKNNGKLQITVEDNGTGFSVPSVNYKGYGLFNIRERMNHINGRFEIKSVPGQGTKVTLVAPFTIDNEPHSKEHL